jgi:hypothetical protein
LIGRRRFDAATLVSGAQIASTLVGGKIDANTIRNFLMSILFTLQYSGRITRRWAKCVGDAELGVCKPATRMNVHRAMSTALHSRMEWMAGRNLVATIESQTK